jgi:hypothetical protein
LIIAHWIEIFSFACLAVNIGLIIFNYRMARRSWLLDCLLVEITISAFRMQKTAPIWRILPERRALTDIDFRRG